MKKLFRLFGLLIAVSTLMCLSSCGGITGTGTGEEENTTMDYSKPINHTFIKNSTDTGYFVCHYNAQNIFSYKNYTNCYYQIEFTNSSPKKFNLYSRTKESTNVLQTIAKGTFTGDPWKEGDVVLTITEGQSASQTITIKKDQNGVLYFTGDVAASHAFIGATDAK